MPDEENKEVEDLGCLPNGCHIFRRPNKAGGYTYYSDEISGGVVIWDTCLVNEGTLLAAMACEHHRKYLEYMHNQGWRPNRDMKNERMAATGGGFLDPIGESDDSNSERK